MKALDQASLAFTRLILDIHERSARYGLSLLDEAIDSYEGEIVSMRVSTSADAHEVRSNRCYVVRYTDDDDNSAHVTVVADESLYIAQNPLPRTSYDQARWVRDVVRLVLDAPDREPAPRPTGMEELLKAYELIDEAGAIQDADMRMDRVGANPLGTGGIHVCLLHQKKSLSDHDDPFMTAGPVRIDVVQNRNPGNRSTTTRIWIEAHRHTTPVPAADAVERLRMMRKQAVDERTP